MDLSRENRTHFCYVAGQQTLNRFVLYFKRWPFLFSVAFICLVPVSAQLQQDDGTETPLLFEFVKGDIELPSSGSFFNVVRVENRSEREFSGAIRITVPEGWKMIGGGATEIELWPGEEKLIPFRVSVPPGVLGGISYTINAELRSEISTMIIQLPMSLLLLFQIGTSILIQENIFLAILNHRVTLLSASPTRGIPMR